MSNYLCDDLWKIIISYLDIFALEKLSKCNSRLKELVYNYGQYSITIQRVKKGEYYTNIIKNVKIYINDKILNIEDDSEDCAYDGDYYDSFNYKLSKTTNINSHIINNIYNVRCGRHIDDLYLSKIKNVEELYLNDKITDYGLSNLKKIRKLDVGYNGNITINCILNLKNLEELTLGDNINITYENLIISKIKILNINNTNKYIKAEQIKKLKEKGFIVNVIDMLLMYSQNYNILRIINGNGGLYYSN